MKLTKMPIDLSDIFDIVMYTVGIIVLIVGGASLISFLLKGMLL